MDTVRGDVALLLALARAPAELEWVDVGGGYHALLAGSDGVLLDVLTLAEEDLVAYPSGGQEVYQRVRGDVARFLESWPRK